MPLSDTHVVVLGVPNELVQVDLYRLSTRNPKSHEFHQQNHQNIQLFIVLTLRLKIRLIEYHVI